MIKRRWPAVACAMALGMVLARAGNAAADDSPSSAVAIGTSATIDETSVDAAITSTSDETADFTAFLDPTITDLQDPQPLAFSVAAEGEDSSEPSPRRATMSLAIARPAELEDSPMAPLPPAVVAGPIGIAFAAYFAWRSKRRGGRV